MGTKYDKLVDELTEMSRAQLRHPDYYRFIAENTWARYKALLDAGFNESQAVAIVASQGIGFDTAVKN